MLESDDIALLKEYAESGSESAFAELIARYVNLVYSAALRSVGNAHAAQEIAQAVFIILARKAKSLGDKTVLSGWLYQTARLTAANYLRGETRRHHREQEAYMQAILDGGRDASSQFPESEVWQQIAPLLDDAMGRLGEKDRNAIVLRFFENKNLSEVGAALGASEDAAKMRVNRALDKLRKFFSKRGVDSTVAAIGETISSNSVQVAPVALAKTISAVAVAKGAAASGSTLILVKGALKIMAWTKMKTAVIAGAVLILAAGTTTVIVIDRAGHAPIKLVWTSAEVESYKQETTVRMNQSKLWALACIMFASDHGGRLPDNFDQLKSYAVGNNGQKISLSSSNWELVSAGSLSGMSNPSQTILLREIKSRQSPDGKFVKVYALADGHVQVIASTTDIFSNTENKFGFVVQPPK